MSAILLYAVFEILPRPLERAWCMYYMGHVQSPITVSKAVINEIPQKTTIENTVSGLNLHAKRKRRRGANTNLANGNRPS